MLKAMFSVVRRCSTAAATAAMSSATAGPGRPVYRSAAHAQRSPPADEIRVLDVRRVTKVTKGGKMLSFAALVVSGNLRGFCGWGYGKAPDVPSAVQKAVEQSKKHRIFIEDLQTIPHAVEATVAQTQVQLRPGRDESGVRANRNVTALAQVAGIKNLSAKVHGSTNKVNVVRAAFNALQALEAPEEVAQRRGVLVRDL